MTMIKNPAMSDLAPALSRTKLKTWKEGLKGEDFWVDVEAKGPNFVWKEV
jgi:hypothetical protein